MIAWITAAGKGETVSSLSSQVDNGVIYEKRRHLGPEGVVGEAGFWQGVDYEFNFGQWCFVSDLVLILEATFKVYPTQKMTNQKVNQTQTKETNKAEIWMGKSVSLLLFSFPQVSLSNSSTLANKTIHQIINM